MTSFPPLFALQSRAGSESVPAPDYPAAVKTIVWDRRHSEMSGKPAGYASPSIPPAPDLEALAFKNPAKCNVSHHAAGADKPSKIAPSLDFLYGRQVPVLQLVDNSVDDTTLWVSNEDRDAFSKVATAWESKHSRILFGNGATPIIDEAYTVVMYLVFSSQTQGVSFHEIVDPDGKQIAYVMEERPLESDPLGNELAAFVITVGGSALVSRIARALATRIGAAAITKALSTATVSAAKAISSEAGRAVLVFLRAIRARALAKALQKRGLQVIVNLGGEASPYETKAFGEHITLNNAPRIAKDKRFIPNLIKEPADSLGDMFEAETVDRIVSVRLPKTFDPRKVASGAARVLKKGGQLEMHIYSGDPVFAKQFVKALTEAKFIVSKPMANSLFKALKP